MPALRFANADAYIADIRAIRDAIRANGSLARSGEIVLTHPNQPLANVTLIMNLALQPNGSFPTPNGSLYIVAFRNAHGTFPFNTAPFPIPAIPGAAAAIPHDGSYASLGYNNNTSELTSINLGDAIAAISAYAGGQTAAPLTTGLARIIIASAEAVRFTGVANGIAGALRGTAYVPDWDSIHNWDARTMGSN